MGISLPPDIRKLCKEHPAKEGYLIHIYTELKRYFEPDRYALLKQLNRFEKTNKHPLNYVLIESLEAFPYDYSQAQVKFTWVQKYPVGPFTGNSNDCG